MSSDICSYVVNPDLFGIFNTNAAPLFIFYGYVVSIIFSLVIGFFAITSFIKDKTMLGYAFISLMISYFLMSLNELVLWTAAPHAILKISWFLVFPTEFLFLLSLGIICYAVINREFNMALVHNHIRIGFLVAAITPFWINIKSYDPIECNGNPGPLIYILYLLKILLFLYILYTFYKVQKVSFKNELKVVKIILTSVILICFTLFVGVDVFTQLTDNYNFDTTRVFGVVIVVAAILWLMAVKEKDQDYQTYQINEFGPAQALVLLLLVANIVLLVFLKREGIETLYRVLNVFNVIFIAIVFMFSSFQQRQKIILNKLNKNLIELDQQKNEFLSFATHQLKSPLTAMKWGMETLKDMGFTPEETEQRVIIIDKLYGTTNDLIRTVTDLLDISKIEQGGLVLKTEDFAWTTYVKQVAEEFSIPASKKGLKLVVNVPSESIMINGDQTKLRQVLVNIIDNAIKYTPTGTITVSLTQEANELHTIVADTGPGIDAEEITKLFGKFSRGAAGKDGGGSGLGLFLVKKVIELHNGRVWASSNGIGYGSQFHIVLPVKGSVSTPAGSVAATVTPVTATVPNTVVVQKSIENTQSDSATADLGAIFESKK